MHSYAKNTCITLFILLQFVASAQVFDSARLALKKEPGLDLILGSRFSFFQNQPAVIQSVGLGFAFEKKLYLGICYHWLSNSILNEKTFYSSQLDDVVTAKSRLYMRYFSIYADLVYHKTKRWKFDIPIYAGIGRTFFKDKETNLGLTTPKKIFFIYEPAVHVQFKIIRWLGIGANIGFRFVVQKDKFISNQFNSPTYALGLSISWDELAKDLFPENKYVQKFGPKAW
jgi:hypothetical protein